MSRKKTYIARCVSLEFNDPSMREKYLVFKIGSSENPAVRMEHLRKDKYSDYYGEIFLLEAEYDQNIENMLHRRFNGRRINYGLSRELFYFSPEEMEEIIADYNFSCVGWEYDKKHNFAR